MIKGVDGKTFQVEFTACAGHRGQKGKEVGREQGRPRGRSEGVREDQGRGMLLSSRTSGELPVQGQGQREMRRGVRAFLFRSANKPSPFRYFS